MSNSVHGNDTWVFKPTRDFGFFQKPTAAFRVAIVRVLYHLDRNFMYVAMGFSVLVEVLGLRRKRNVRRKRQEEAEGSRQ